MDEIEQIRQEAQMRRRISEMSHDEKVSAYRMSRPGDPFGDLLAEDLQKPMAGETPEQAATRAGGTGTTVPKWYSNLSGAADSMTFGLSDEMSAGMDAALGRKTYDQGLAAARQQQDEAFSTNPWSYRAGQVEGAVLPGLLTAGGSNAPTIGGQALRGAGLGATEGAFYGFNSGKDDIQNRILEALKGGTLGAAVGGAAPYVAAGLGKGYGAIRDYLKNGAATDATKANRQILDMLQKSGLDVPATQQRLSELGPRSLLADVTPGMQVETAGTSIADSGAGSLITDALKPRREGAGNAVRDMLDNHIGPFKDPQALADEIATLRAPAGPAYELAKTHVVDPEPALAKIDDLLKTFGPKSDTGQALLKYKSQLIDDAGNVIGGGNIVHGVREEIDSALRSGNIANKGPLIQVRRELDNALKTQIPGFAEADKIWSTTAKMDEAFKYGQSDLMSSKVFPGQNLAKVQKMTAPEIEAMKQGARANIEMKMAGGPNPAGRMERLFEQNMNDQKLGQIMPSQAVDALRKGLDAESTFMETSALAEAARGSRTAPLQAAAGERWGVGKQPNSALSDAVSAFMGGAASGNPVAGLASAASVGGNRLRQAVMSKFSKTDPALIQETARRLVAGKANQQRLLQALTNTQGRDAAKTVASKNAAEVIRRLIQMNILPAVQEGNRF